MNPQDSSPPSTNGFAGAALLCLAFGLYLLVGACLALVRGKWPGFLPPQLDGIALLFSWLPGSSGVYVAGVLVGLLGLCSVAGGIVLWTRPAERKSEGEPRA